MNYSWLCTLAYKAIEPLLSKSLTNVQVLSDRSYRKIHATHRASFGLANEFVTTGHEQCCLASILQSIMIII